MFAPTTTVLVLTLVGFAEVGFVSAGKLEQDLLSIEATVSNLAAAAEADYASWICGQNPQDTSELACYHDSCKSKIANPQCSSDVKSAAFGGCADGFSEVVVGFEETSILFAEADSSTKADVGGDIFWTAGMKQKMKASNLATDVVSWQYIATPSGIARTYPANRQEVCYDYDPRVRPWYVAATSGPKDVVIVIDKSGSMTIEDRIGLTIDAVKSVLVTLSANDFVAVVVFDDVGQQLCDDTTGLKCGMLSQATSVNKDILNRLVEGIIPSAGTNFLAGLKIAFPLFTTEKSEGASSSGCSRALLFLTDGVDGTNNQQLTQQIVALNAAVVAADRKDTQGSGDSGDSEDGGNSVIMFTYSLGDGAARDIPKQMACDGKGIWSAVNDNGNIRGQMSHFYDYFSSQRASGDSRVTWSEPYEDSFGAGLMTTSSKAIYDKSVTPPKLVAVVGVDILMTSITAAAAQDGLADQSSLLAALARRGATCVEFSVTDECTLAHLRQADYSGGNSDMSLLLGNSENTVTAAERLCDSDPKTCGETEPACAGLSAGRPKELSKPCNTARGTSFQDKCEGCDYTLPGAMGMNNQAAATNLAVSMAVVFGLLGFVMV